jgi:thiol-disulfide isomerase/thioredoxin
MELDQNTYILLGLIILALGIMVFMCSSKSNFGEKTTPADTKIAKDTVAIVYSPGCGYCVEAMDEFKKAESQGNGKVVMVDATDKENKDTVNALKVEGYPTIVKGDGTQFKGNRTASDILKFANKS